MNHWEDMSEQSAESIRKRLEELEREKKKLLSELPVLQTQRDFGEINHPPIGERISSETPKTPDEKIDLFLKLFACRTDVFPKFWENKKTGKKGYSPVCSNEWVREICKKPKIKCTDCKHKAFEKLDEKSISDHLTGKITLGTYTIRSDDTCKFLAADFDDKQWEQDIIFFKKEAEKLGIDVAIERSRSGHGGHAWIFFSEFIPASLARRLGSVIMTRAIMRSTRFDLSSYDRFFPNQDYMPKGGFGNLIALPLQKMPRQNENSVFISDDFKVIENQWEFMSSIRALSHLEVLNLVNKVSSSFEKIDTSFEDKSQSWSEKSLDMMTKQIKNQYFGQKITAELSSQLYINTEGVSSKLVAAFKRLATFANPEFFKKQKMRFSTWNIPRYIFCGELRDSHLILPIGLLEKVEEICKDTGSRLSLKDSRPNHRKFKISFKGKLKKEQKRATKEIIQHENGVFVAPPGSGKTIVGCAVISKRKIPTLILVHRSPLLDQWRQRLSEFVNFDVKKIGIISGQKKKPQEKIDIAMMQTLSKMDEGDLQKLLSKYEQIIADECHHIAAFTFELILKNSPARYILGLTATPYRKDGHQAIIYMQSGPVRYEMSGEEIKFNSKRVIVRNSDFKLPDEVGPQPPVHQVWNHLINDKERLQLVSDDIIENLDEARIPLVLSERKEHLQLLKKNLLSKNISESCVFILDGDLSKKQRDLILDEINTAIDRKKPICILTTGSFIGEGFDLPALDTLFLAMPIAFKGRIIQYAGRIHRHIKGKNEVRIYDYVDPWSALTLSMFKKRAKAYRNMGYKLNHLQQCLGPFLRHSLAPKGLSPVRLYRFPRQTTLNQINDLLLEKCSFFL